MKIACSKRMIRIVSLWVLAVGLSGLAQAQRIIVEPASPRAHEAIRVRVLKTFVPADELATIAISGNKIVITQVGTELLVYPAVPIVPRDPDPRYNEYLIGPLPTGSYVIEHYDSVKGSLNPPVLGATTQITVAAATVGRTAPYPFLNYSDLWWHTAEPGWGISIHAKNDKLFAAWFVYDATGKPSWYTVQAGNWTASNVYTGLVVKATGPSMGGLMGMAGAVTPSQAGTATLTFSGYDSATFVGTVDGIPFAKALTRQPF